MRIRPALAALLIPALLLLGCSASGDDDAGDDKTTTTADGGGGKTTTTAEGDDPTTTEGGDPELPDDADEALAAAADATLEAESFTIESEALLEVGFQTVRFSASGSVDYATPMADVTIAVDQTSGSGEVGIRADGTNVWVRSEGPTAPAFPDGKTWAEGDIDLLAESDTLEPIGLVGVVVALRAATDTEAEDGGEIDGVSTTKYTTTISYEEAVEKAGDEEEGFKSAFSLTAPEDPILDVVAWVGDDGIVRRFQLEIQESDNAVAPTGSYDLELTGVDQEIEVPEAPPADETVTGQEAEDLLDVLVS